MRTALENSVLRHIRTTGMIGTGARVCVAVSGGADSVAMFRLLLSLQDELGITLLVAHFNHNLRGEESDQDQQFVESLARENGVEAVTGSRDVMRECERNGWNLEDGARKLRYQFLEGVVGTGKADRVAVAHTIDDQAETVLAQVIRGTGPTGLGGIYPVVGSVVRPLLETRRSELREYLLAVGQAWREDSTNQDTRRLRARIREKLLPVLSTEFSPAITRHLGKLARLAREESTAWDGIVEGLFAAAVSKEGDRLTIACSALSSPFEQEDGTTQSGGTRKSLTLRPFRTLTERLIRRLYQETRGNLRELTAAHVELVIDLAESGTSDKQVELPGGIRARRMFDELIFSRGSEVAEDQKGNEPNAASDTYQYVVDVPDKGVATIQVAELDTCFYLKKIDWSQAPRDTEMESGVLDAELLGFPLILRNCRPGDAYRPQGRRHERKLKELFLAKRVPAEQRAKWPVLESKGRIVWARNLPPSADFLVSRSTKVGLVIEDAPLAVDSMK